MPTQLTVTQLFQPAPSGVGPYGNVGGATVGAVPQVPGDGTWLATMRQIAATVQLPTTAWQPGGPERTILATEAVCFALSDAVISQMAQGGFLQSAASGSVTYTTPQGQTITVPVTPDPSNPAQNPTGAPGCEDLLAENVYGVERLQASYATGPLAIAKLSAGTLTYPAGQYHVSNTFSGATYHNQNTLSIVGTPSGVGGGITAVNVAGPAQVILTTASAHGLVQGQAIYIAVPSSSGVSGLAGVFAAVTAVPTSNTLYVSMSGVSGTYSGSGGNVYTVTLASMVADAVGTGSSASPNAVTTAITQNANVFVGNVVSWAGSNYESNVALANRCVLSLAARSPNGPSQAYEFFALSSFQLLQKATPPYTLMNGPVQAVAYSTPGTGVVVVVVASSTPNSTTLGQPVTPGVSQLSIAGVSAANPAVITCTGPTGLSAGQTFTVTISGVLGPTAVNGTFIGTYVSPTSFSIPVDTTSAPAYVSGGSCEGGDLGQIHQLLQRNCVPDNTAAIAVSALALPVQVTTTVTVPQAYVASYQVAVVTQLQAQIASYGIGGSARGVTEIAYDDIVGALEEAGVQALGQVSVVRQIVSLSLNSQPAGVGVPFPVNTYQAILVNPAITVLGV